MPILVPLLVTALITSSRGAEQVGAGGAGGVLAEYRAALSSLESKFTRVSGTGVRIEERVGTPKEIRGVPVEVSFARDGGLVKVSRVWGGKAGDGAPHEKVFSQSNEYAFYLEMPFGSDSYSLKGLEDGAKSQLADEARDFFDNYVEAPFRAFGARVLDIMDDPSFRLAKVEEVSEGGAKLWKIEFSYNPNKKFDNRLSCAVFVSPAEGWVTRRYWGRYDSGKRLERSGEVEYRTGADGSAVLARVVHNHSQYKIQFQFDTISFGAVPRSEFTLSHFGMPEVGELKRPAQPGGVPLAYWSFGVTAAAVVAALVLWRLGRRPAPSRS